MTATGRPPEPAGGASMTSVSAGAGASTVLNRFESPSAAGGFAAVARVARADLIDLAVVLGLTLVSLGLGIGLALDHLATRREAARLEGLVKRAGDYEASLAAVEARIAERRGDLAALAARVPSELSLDAVESRIKFKAEELGLEQEPIARIDEKLVTERVGPAGDLRLKRYDRGIDLRGGFGDVLRFLAAVEAWDELVAVRGFKVVRSTRQTGYVQARVEVSIYQALPA